MKVALLLVTLALAGCEGASRRFDAIVGETKQPVHQITKCIYGIEYFVMWNSNAFDPMYPVAPVIDAETLKPRKCPRVTGATGK